MLNLGENAPKGATQVQRSHEPVQSAPWHPSELQDLVEQFMRAGEPFGSACVLARAQIGLSSSRLITTADIGAIARGVTHP